MVVAVIVHPIDVAKHPTVPKGFRWCAQLDTDPLNQDSWLNAGWAATKNEAATVGEMVASAAFKALSASGIAADYLGVIYLAEDPIPGAN